MQLIPRMFRMSGFLAMNVPIICAMILTKPTMINTVMAQWLNQSYMAGLNYCNKNPQSSFSNEDLLRGYSGAVAASLIVAISLRKMT